MSAAPFTELLVDERATVRAAMECLNANAREVVFVCDTDGRMTGLITDGDIRRGLLAGRTLESPVIDVMHRDFYSVGPETDRATVLDVMKARHFQHVPVLDQNRRLVAAHFLRDLIGGGRKPNIAVIMAGGKGTRLKPITESIPKPMIEVAGRPMLERIVLHLVGHGIQQVYLAVNYKAELIEEYFGGGERFGCSISYLRETEPRGTGGPLSLLPERPAHPILVLNGDQVTRVDLSAMLEHHRVSGASATIGAGPYKFQFPYGVITEKNGRLVSLQEKPSIGVVVNRGVYVLDPRVLDVVPAKGDFPITSLVDLLLEAGEPVGVFHFDDYWLDVGRPTDLQQANGIT